MNLRGYKVVNYNEWKSMPDIFTTITQAKDALSGWKFSKGAIIESFNQKSNYTKVVFYNK